MSQDECVIGIDLGTTNSEVAAFVGDQVRLLGPADSKILPSCVGLSPTGELLVGRSARNQQLIYPERTVRSIKRRIGGSESVKLGDKTFTPPEISALILRELVQWAQRQLRRPVSRAVITVPAYFSDAQRQATREAGALAGLAVDRILNEPTAASLAYGLGSTEPGMLLVYDLGGGTFDVSIVINEGEVTEVLASHGNNQLGGDDFDRLLVDLFLREFRDSHGIDLRQGHAAAYSRLWWAAEEAKKKLSFEQYVQVREEALVTVRGEPLHLEVELSREQYEEMIAPLVESTLESVTKAMADAGKAPGDLDAVLLVGGATRTPFVSRVLEERTGLIPRQEVDPELCVALGAGVLASRLAGHEIAQVLVDVTPYSFGPSYLGERDGALYSYCYHPIIRRNTALPVTRTERYSTAHPYQTEVDVNIYQGDDLDALKNIKVGDFRVTGLTPTEAPNEVLVRMGLDLDGILKVTAVEKVTGKSKQVVISNVLEGPSAEEMGVARRRLEEVFAGRIDEPGLVFSDDTAEALERTGDKGLADSGLPRETGDQDAEPGDDQVVLAIEEATNLMERSRGLFEKMHPDDREEAIGIHERIQAGIKQRDRRALEEPVAELRELLFFVEAK